MQIARDVLATFAPEGYPTNRWLGQRLYLADCGTDCISKVYEPATIG
jgi:hypothetical protein